MSAPSPRSVLPLKWEKRLPPKRGNPLPRMRHTPSVSLRVQRYKKNMDWANFSERKCGESGFCSENTKKLAVRCCELGKNSW